jgi:D-alanyl-D-alanine carboxypeptidase
MRIGFVARCALTFAAITCCGARVAAAPVSLADPAVRSAIVASVEKNRVVFGGRTPVPGVVIAVWDGLGHNFVRTFGYADLAKRRPMSADDHFRIGSNTKTFVVATVLQLVDEGKLSLDDPLSKFDIGVTVPNAKNITVRQMCQMRSGLFEVYDAPEFSKMDITGETKFDARTMIGWAVKQKPYFAPGKGYHYSNTNYLILGQIIEKLTGDTVGNQIRKRLLERFELNDTSYPATQAMPDPWARGYGLDKQRNWEDVSGTIPVSLMGSAGEMVSTIWDMRRWIRLYTTGKTSSPATFEALRTCLPIEGNIAFGLGLGCSAGWYGYTGGLPGYNTANYYFPDRDITIVAWVDAQISVPKPDVANAMFRDIAAIMTPDHKPIQGKGI